MKKKINYNRGSIDFNKLGRLYKLYLNKLDKPYLDAYMSQCPSKSVQQFETLRSCKGV